jgi:hypothetical protein
VYLDLTGRKWQEAGEDFIMRSFITFRVIKSRGMGLVGHVPKMGEVRNAYKIFIRKSEGKRPLGRSRHRWEDNIRMNHRKTGWELVA